MMFRIFPLSRHTSGEITSLKFFFISISKLYESHRFFHRWLRHIIGFRLYIPFTFEITLDYYTQKCV